MTWAKPKDQKPTNTLKNEKKDVEGFKKSSIGSTNRKTKKTWWKPSVKGFIISIEVDQLINTNQWNNELSEKCETKLKIFVLLPTFCGDKM